MKSWFKRRCHHPPTLERLERRTLLSLTPVAGEFGLTRAA